ncbi:MAG: cupin domain-containing protein [Gammaproteobacteria bacterium]
MNKVITVQADQAAWKKRDWGNDNLPVVQSERMEMHVTKVHANSIGVAHIHECDTLYYVLQGTIISISGDNLDCIEPQSAGSFVHVPKNLLHTVVNISDDEDAISIVTHDALDVCGATKMHPEHDEKLKDIFAKLKSKVDVA